MANEQQTDPLAQAKSWERQHQAANAPQSASRPPLNPALEEIRQRIERGEMRMPDAPVPSTPYQVPGENLSATDPKQQTARLAEQQEAHKSMLDDLKDFLNKHEHLGLMGINQIIQALNPVSPAQAGEVVNFPNKIKKTTGGEAMKQGTLSLLDRVLGGTQQNVLPINPTGIPRPEPPGTD